MPGEATIIASCCRSSCSLCSPRLGPHQSETGTFRLHKFAQPIGTETYTITRQDDTLTLESHFTFTDRGTPVPLTATLTAAPDYTPRTFTIAGSTSRLSRIDVSVALSGSTARIRDGHDERTMPAPTPVFTIAGYAPVALEMALMRYWKAHGSPASLAILPSGRVDIRDRGADTITIDGREVRAGTVQRQRSRLGHRDVVDGSRRIAGRPGDPRCRVRSLRGAAGWTGARATTFIANAARDEMRELEELSASLPGRRSGTLAFTGATLIRGTADAPIPRATIVTRAGRIVAAGPEDSTPVPSDAIRIDLTGRYIIPGLWDMHAHYEQVEWGPIYLAAGVTTVRDVGNELEFIAAVRDAIREGRGLGPRLLLAGVVDGDGPITLGVARVTNAADAARWVARYHDAGFEQIKIYSSLSEENVRNVCREAHARGMTVTGHIPNGMDIYQGVDRRHGPGESPAVRHGAAPSRRSRSRKGDGPRADESQRRDRCQLTGRRAADRVPESPRHRHRRHDGAVRADFPVAPPSRRPNSSPASRMSRQSCANNSPTAAWRRTRETC